MPTVAQRSVGVWNALVERVSRMTREQQVMIGVMILVDIVLAIVMMLVGSDAMFQGTPCF